MATASLSIATFSPFSRGNNHHGGPDDCPRCKSQGYRGILIATRWRGEASCLQCGYRYYSNNGHGHHSSALSIQTARYLVIEESLSDHELPNLADDSPIFKDFSQVFERCAASNGSCKHCRVERKCRALYDRASRIANQGRFNLYYYRIFFSKIPGFSKNPLTNPLSSAYNKINGATHC